MKMEVVGYHRPRVGNVGLLLNVYVFSVYILRCRIRDFMHHSKSSCRDSHRSDSWVASYRRMAQSRCASQVVFTIFNFLHHLRFNNSLRPIVSNHPKSPL